MSQEIWVVVETVRGEVCDISFTLLAAGRELANGLGGSVTALLLGHNAEGLTATLGAADRVIHVEHPALADFTPELYRHTITAVLKESPPRVVILGQTTMGMDIASGISLDLDAPLVSSCRRVLAQDGQAVYTSLICGGKIIAEGVLPAPCCVITMAPGGYKPEPIRRMPEIVRVTPPLALDDLRIKFMGYLEPATGDVDVTQVPLLVAVGRGMQNKENLQLAEELASVLGGTVVASRPIVDQGWLPLSRLIGKSGRKVKPKLYLALGISGAPEHVEGMSDAEWIVAVNTDEKAPIFEVAHLGAAVDVLDLLPLLTDKVAQAKGG